MSKEIGHLDFEPASEKLRYETRHMRSKARNLVNSEKRRRKQRRHAILAKAAIAGAVIAGMAGGEILGGNVADYANSKDRQKAQAYERCLAFVRQHPAKTIYDSASVKLSDMTEQQMRDCGFNDVEEAASKSADHTDNEIPGVIKDVQVDANVELPTETNLKYAIDDASSQLGAEQRGYRTVGSLIGLVMAASAVAGGRRLRSKVKGREA